MAHVKFTLVLIREGESGNEGLQPASNQKETLWEEEEKRVV